jgi:MATE family multidrug resistance protein
VAACIWQGLWLSLLAGLVIAGLIPVVNLLIPYNGHSPSVQRLEIQYYSILALGSAPILAANVFSAFFSGRNRTLTVMFVNLGAMVANGVLDYLFIFGKHGFPEFGMAGAALATVMANIMACVVFAYLAHREACLFGYPFREHWAWNIELIGRMLRYGLPNGVQLLGDVGAYLVFIMMTGVIGERALAATNLAFNLNSLAFIPMIGLGTAVLTLVGRRIGEGRPELAVRTTWLAVGISGLYMLFFGVLYVGMPETLLAPYASFAEGSDRPEEFAHIQPIVIILLRFVAAYSFFDALAIIFGCAVRGAGDVRFSLIVTTLLGWFVMALPCFLLATFCKEQALLGCWGAATANIVLLGLILMWRFRQGHWRKMNVMD